MSPNEHFFRHPHPHATPTPSPPAYYSLHSDPLDPEHIRAFQLVKLAEDCQLIASTKGAASTDAAVPRLKADVYVAFTAEVTRADKIAPGAGMERSALKMATAARPATASAVMTDRRKVRRGPPARPRARDGAAAPRAHHTPPFPPTPLPPPPLQMNYNDFLTCLLKLAVKVYPRSRSSDEAFQRLLVDNIVPLASRRCPENIDFYMHNAEVVHLFETFKDALEGIFTYYATNDKRAHAGSGAAGGGMRASMAAPGKGPSHSGASPVRATKVRTRVLARARARALPARD